MSKPHGDYATVFHPLWCLGSQRKGMVISVEKESKAVFAMAEELSISVSAKIANEDCNMETFGTGLKQWIWRARIWKLNM